MLIEMGLRAAIRAVFEIATNEGLFGPVSSPRVTGIHEHLLQAYHIETPAIHRRARTAGIQLQALQLR
jgi:hypothetical protein